MATLVAPEDLPKWVPGDILCASDRLGWKNIALRTYHYLGQDVIVPAMRDFMLVGYRVGATPMQRRFEGQWSRATCTPGAVSLLTRAEQSHWLWTETIDVTHLYLSPELVVDVASEMMGQPIQSVSLADILRTDDPFVNAAMYAIAAEAESQGLGGPLYVETIARSLTMHLLRKYASFHACRPPLAGEMTPEQRRRIVDYIDANLEESLDLKSLAATLGLNPCHFSRQFKRCFGMAPYAFVIARRLERAQRLLSKTSLPIKEIAASCGFSDQAHLTRLFMRSRQRTPAAFRKEFWSRGERIPADVLALANPSIEWPAPFKTPPDRRA